MNRGADTIVAIATPPGLGGVGIVRVSGPRTAAIATAVLGSIPLPRSATYRAFRSAAGTTLDRGISVYFPAPASYTGEDVLELHGHGGPVVLDSIVETVLALGARPARPGEFTERAFLNDKLDLVQAEAVADLIECSTLAAARSALRSLEGQFSTRVDALAEQLAALRIYAEAAIDFPDEEVDFLDQGNIADRLGEIQAALERLFAATRQGALLRDGIDVVLAGLPNAGKSSLLNALAGEDRAIVSPRPGTTRDTIDQRLQLEGMVVHVTDTAGLCASADDIEREGVRRARRAMERADHILLIVDDAEQSQKDSSALLAQLPAGATVTIVRNKVDLTGRAPGLEPGSPIPTVAVSAQTGAGLEALTGHLKRSAGFDAAVESTFMARRRHIDAIEQVRLALNRAQQSVSGDGAVELLAEDLRNAHDSLGTITGKLTSDELLGQIFASFCIGK